MSPSQFLRSLFAATVSLGAATTMSALAAPDKLVEPPMLAPLVARGELPPLAERLPETPDAATMDRAHQTLGRHGGTLRLLMAKAKDTKMMTVYGYARLVRYNQDFELVPDILGGVEVEDARVFTLHLREGHRWSDGHPFTSEDFRYYWEDVANNEELNPLGPQQVLLEGGGRPRVEIVDETTVRYTWPEPNPYFLPALAAPAPLFIYRPAHYLKQFHERYAEPAELASKVEEAGARNWADLHHRKDHQYWFDNPDLPSLEPWLNTTRGLSERFVFERNPYFHRIDSDGRQLPYIDRVILNVVDDELIPAKTGSGESDLQARYLRFDNYPFLKQGAARNDYEVRLWRTAKGSHLALYPNLNAADPVWRALLRDVRFRRALSLAIDRHEINQTMYFGLALESNNTVLPESPLFKPHYQKAWARFDVGRANALLDEIGLTERTSNGVRLLPDGRPLNVVVETAGESTEETDILELIRATWRRAGVKLFTRPSQRQLFRSRAFSGKAVMSIWSGLPNGLPTADMSPRELAPTSQGQLQWPKWGQYYETDGQLGEPPALPAAKELLGLHEAWKAADSTARRREIWHRMLEIHSEQVFTIGIVSGVPRPVVVRNTLRNVPAKGVYNWDPGAYFGLYEPETFWFTETRRAEEP